MQAPHFVEVAAAVLLRPDGSYLLAQRPAGKVYAGYWEFPGGKVEPGEPLLQALTRELHEELGIDVVRAYPWIVLTYLYPHARVRLHFHRVLEWRGEPHPREAQRLAWNAPGAPTVAPVLPANGPVLKGLSLPTVMGITHAEQLGVPEQLAALDAALAHGLKLVMVREKQMASAQLLPFAQAVVARCRRAGALAVVNGDIALARSSAADGVHLPAAQLLAANSRPAVEWCGASCHDVGELEHAARLELDYVLLGPVLPTLSHPGAPTLGWEHFTRLIERYSLPVLAVGGMGPAQLQTAWRAGAHGVAMLRAAWGQFRNRS
jgi:8-oxo-dGTP diphosphatase